MILVALAVLVVNDHVLKSVAPGPLTGILSGLAGLVLTPALLVAGVELASSVRARWVGPSVRPMLGACLLVGTAYAAVELVPLATDLYRWTWGALQWPGASALALAEGGRLPAVVPVRAVADPADLLALPVLLVPIVIQARRASAAFGTLAQHPPRATDG